MFSNFSLKIRPFITGVLISPQPDQEENKLQRQKILMFIYPIYNHNRRNINTIYIYIYTHTHTYIHTYIHTGCPRRNVPDFGRMFPKLKYTDITQNTYIQSQTVMEIMAREKCGLFAVQRTVLVKPTRYPYTAHVRP